MTAPAAAPPAAEPDGDLPAAPASAGPSAGGHGFGTAPVFLASISTILGAVLFLRFGYAVGSVGMVGALLIVLLGHLVTVPTALAISEIATNRRVEGGGEYFIISRSFGPSIGAAIGIALYLSQAVSVAFYMIAFAESFRPWAGVLEGWTGMAFDPRAISLPGTIVLAALVLTRGANLGVKALWVVASVLGVSLALFFLGPAVPGEGTSAVLHGVPGGDPFMLVFAIVFPAFTGMTAGVGLSGDLRNPARSLPLGVLSATGLGLLVYIAVVIKMAVSAPAELLASDPLSMSHIALWGPIIPIGLACATVSSAIGSILVAPRTLQALAGDGVLPGARANRWMEAGIGGSNEPRNATLVTSALALVTVALGSVDFVARMISMFFMVTYGSLCAISFLEHLAARPSYRPSFRSKWYFSLIGAVLSGLLMFQMDPGYALIAIVVMGLLYRAAVARRRGRADLAAIFQGVMTQTTRRFQVLLQRSSRRSREDEWRPRAIMVNGRTFDRLAPLQLLAWICHRYGVGTYLHFIPGRLDRETFVAGRRLMPRLIQLNEQLGGGLYVDTVVSPSMRSALAQTLQVPGATGLDNNTAVFELSAHDPEEVVEEVCEGCQLAGDSSMSALVLRHGDRFFGTRRRIQIWLTWHDHDNAPLMILVAYILLGHPDWAAAEIRLNAAFPVSDVERESAHLREMIGSGRLPIRERNLRIIGTDVQDDFDALVESRSDRADLVIFGFTQQRLREKGPSLLLRHPSVPDALFVSAGERIEIG